LAGQRNGGDNLTKGWRANSFGHSMAARGIRVIIRDTPDMGAGTFAPHMIKKGTVVASSAFIKKRNTGEPDRDYVRRCIGSFTNHSKKPNMDIERKGNRYMFIANKDIKKDDQLFVDYDKFDFEGKRKFKEEAQIV